MSRNCGSSALLVGGDHRFPADPCEYNFGFDARPGCNRLRCASCGADVRTGAVGLSLKDGERPKDLTAMYATEDWASLPFVTNEQSGWRLYACKCETWQELDHHLLENDHDSPGDPDLPWRCAGHPVPELPLSLGELTIAADTDWAALVQRILDGACPRRLDRADEGPWLWLPWLYAYLKDLPVRAKLSRAIGDRAPDRAEHVVAAVLAFFRRFPVADGIERVVACAEADVAAVFAGHKVPEVDYRPSLWGALISALMMRTDENDALDVRVIDVVRKAMLRPAGKPDAVTEVLSWAYADAFRDADLAWMAENIAALDAAGPGRWTKIMTMLVAASRKKVELEHLIVIGGIALIQSRRVDTSAIRAWMQKRGHKADAWVVALESALDKNR
ncbi:MAG: hypothetical protein H0V89_09235 [Deltaproteobacteria bacterium]|nr:hypothetical protein [Deltaproteobacteria bacterium]